MCAIWRLSKSAGVPPLTSGALLWPYPLLSSFRVLDDEQRLHDLKSKGD